MLGISKIYTQEAFLNVTSRSFLLTFGKSLPNYYLISRIVYFVNFLVDLRKSKRYEKVTVNGSQFLLYKDADITELPVT